MVDVEIGFIGVGQRAQAHYRSLQAIDDAEITAICARHQEHVDETGDRYGIERRYTDYVRMLDKEALDGVYIVMAPGLLDPLVSTALKHGENVFVEKPPGTTSEQTRRWADLAVEHECLTCVGFQRRFNPIAVAAYERVSKRGDVGYVVGTFHKDQLEPRKNQLRDDLIHIVDLMVWLGDGIEEVHGFHKQTFADPSEFDQFHANQFAAVFELENGGLGLLSANRTAGGRSLSIEVHGKRVSAYGSINGNPTADQLRVQADDAPITESDCHRLTDLLDAREPETRIDGTYQLNHHFVDCIQQDRMPDTSFANTVESMRAMEAINHGERLGTHFNV